MVLTTSEVKHWLNMILSQLIGAWE